MERVHVVRVWRKEGRPAHSRAERGGSGRRRGLDGGGLRRRAGGRARALRVEAEAVALDDPRAGRRLEAQDERLAKGARVAAVVLDMACRGDKQRRADGLDGGRVDCVRGADGEGKCGLGVLFGSEERGGDKLMRGWTSKVSKTVLLLSLIHI